MPAASQILIGAMSGTSADGVDVAAVRIEGHGLSVAAQLLHHHHFDYPADLKSAIYKIRADAAVELRDLAALARNVSNCYADAVNELIKIAKLNPDQISAIAAHGQTLYHSPPETIQWLDPSLLAARTGCRVVSDFRRADCAAGGQGAPLVPLADFILFRDENLTRLLLNLGGIANLTFLPAGGNLQNLIAFDTGPANCIADHLMRRHDPAGPGFDPDGRLARSGNPIEPIVQQVLSNPYFSEPPPKSTDGPAMIGLFTAARDRLAPAARLEDLLRTACRISAETIAQSIRQFCPHSPDELILSGGGIHNQTLIEALKSLMGEIPLRPIDEFGVPSTAKEAIAFAILGAATLDGAAGNVPAATGANRAVVLGSITPRPVARSTEI